MNFTKRLQHELIEDMVGNRFHKAKERAIDEIERLHKTRTKNKSLNEEKK